MSIIGYDNAGAAGRPSNSIFGDCPNTLLNDKSLGFYVNNQFLGDVATLPGMPLDGDGGTFTYNTGGDGNRTLNILTGSTDNNAEAIFTRPLGKVVKNSGQKIWFEADVALAALTDQGIFVGLAELAGLDRDVIADNGLVMGTESTIGFLCRSSNTDAFDAVYTKDAATEVVVLADVTNATALVLADRSSLVADTFVKLGIKFNGTNKFQYFVNGIQVATQTVDSTVDQAKEYGGIISVKTGAAAARTLKVRFIRAAAQLTD